MKGSSPDDHPQMERLHGDASSRTYWRVTGKDGKSVVIMKLPTGKASVSEEITNLKTPPKELPFLNIARYLKKEGIPVPEVYQYLEEKGSLVLEDLGDLTLEALFKRIPAHEKEEWYRRAIDLLIRLQALKPSTGKGCIALQRSFDERLLNWEFDHFLEYGIEARQEIRLTESERKVFREETRRVTEDLVSLPQVFTHRDFQSRNLMVQEEKLRLIDFQDALLGPPQYDLVALLRDSYTPIPWGMVETLLEDYLKKRRETPRDFKKMFDWMTVQRKLKDAGRFVYIDRMKQNRSFLPFIPRSLAYAREALLRQPELHRLLRFLEKHVPEFR